MTTSAECRRYACRYCTNPDCDHDCHNDPNQGDLLTPERPYTQEGAKSAGWSGTETSKAAEPVRAASQKQVLAYVLTSGKGGATVKEVRDATGLHHGVASGALSVLHKRGHLARLTEKRGGCRVYVHPDDIMARDHD